MKRTGRLGLTILYTGGGGGIVTKSCQTLASPWTVACQAPLSAGFSRQEYWSGLPFPSPGELPNQNWTDPPTQHPGTEPAPGALEDKDWGSLYSEP